MLRCSWLYNGIVYDIYTDCTVMQTDKLERNSVVANTNQSQSVAVLHWAISLSCQCYISENLSCDTTLSLRCALCGRIISPPWIKALWTAVRGRNAQGSHRRQMELVKWGLTLVPECRAVDLNIIHVQKSLNLLQSAARCLTWWRLVGVVGKEFWTFDWRRS